MKKAVKKQAKKKTTTKKSNKAYLITKQQWDELNDRIITLASDAGDLEDRVADLEAHNLTASGVVVQKAMDEQKEESSPVATAPSFSMSREYES
jgi:hypothetical protein